MPPAKYYMTVTQKNGIDFDAEEIYTETWNWLSERRCQDLVSPQLISQYAMAVARWIQCEMAISEYGFLAKHPTTGAAIASPYVAMSREYMKQINQLWYQIFQVVKENSTAAFQGSNPQDDLMERLLTARGRS
ncbi:MAG TPA: P27 family phage terminase small subunit [Sphaerochaeta sp.]|nr:P27 family phage terminase small subunit [Sphaerochaeta sp.]